MAGMTQNSLPSSARGIPASTQLAAVAWLRWRIFINGLFRRRKLGARKVIGIVFAVLLRIIVWPIMAMTVIGPVFGSAFVAWMTISENHPQHLAPLFGGITLLWLFVAINGQNIAASFSTFDPSTLARFPLRFGRYLVLRTLVGLLTPSTIVGCLSLLAAAISIGVARPSLAIPALIALALYALMNILFMRMIGVWLERWLANRRFREFFGALMAIFAASIQFLNLLKAPSYQHNPLRQWLFNSVQGSSGYWHWLPPGFAADFILQAAHPLAMLLPLAGLFASILLFLWAYAVRLHKQFLGELLSENFAPRSASRKQSPRKTLPQPVSAATIPAPRASRAIFPPVLAACLRKEWIVLRSSGAQMISMLLPLVFVFLMGRTIFSRHSDFFLPGAIAYVMMGILAGLYNVFGADGLGVQVYLLAPVRMRDVIVAKNLIFLSLILGEVGIAWALVSVLSHNTIPLSAQVATAFWTVFVIAANLSLGIVRSIQAPRKFVPGQTRQQRSTQTNRTSGLLILLVLFGSVLLQVPAILLSRHLHQPWLGALIFAPFALAAVFAYALVLRNAERLVLAHRDVFAEELCKV